MRHCLLVDGTCKHKYTNPNLELSFIFLLLNIFVCFMKFISIKFTFAIEVIFFYLTLKVWLPSPAWRANYCVVVQVQTALCPSRLLRPSGSCPASNHRLSLWAGRPIRQWYTQAWCGPLVATPSTTPTTTWSSSKLSFSCMSATQPYVGAKIEK